MKTKVKAKSIKKVAMPKYIVTTFVDKKEKRTFRIIEKIVPKQIVYEAINTWYYSTNKEYKDFPWYKDQKIKKDKYRTATITYTDNDPYDTYKNLSN